MKSILLSIKPRHCANILNRLKTKEIRKFFPKDYRGWVYIYCTKDKSNKLHKNRNGWFANEMNVIFVNGNPIYDNYNGKVIARFYCDNVTEYINGGQWHSDDTFGNYDDYIKDNILEQSCLTEEELFAYCEDLAFSSINISQLEIFDTPKELSEFKSEKIFYKYDFNYDKRLKMSALKTLTKAPQSWCYIEVKE